MASSPGSETISVVIPVQNEQANVGPLLERLSQVFSLFPVQPEFIFINDGSTDESGEKLRAARERDPRVKIIELSRNFGHQSAITAGIDHAEGDACIIMDGDLQDPPEVIPHMISKWKEGYDVVYAVRDRRDGETFFKKATALGFYRLLRMLTEVPIPADAGDFRLMDRRVVLALRQMEERGRFLRGLVNWVGFKQTAITFARESRHAGQTKFSVRRMMSFAVDAITSFSIVPLQIATTLGFVFSLTAFVYSLYAFRLHFFTGRTITGWTSLMVMILFFGGVQLIFLGILGEYIGRIFQEVKRRPLYIVRSREGFTDPNTSGTSSPAV